VWGTGRGVPDKIFVNFYVKKIRVPTPPGKSWIFLLKIPGSGKSWKITLGLESHGKMSLNIMHFSKLLLRSLHM